MKARKLVEEFTKFELDKDKQAFLDKYEMLTDENRHGEAIEALCNYFKEDELAEKMTHINALHFLYGSLRPELRALRDEIDIALTPRFLVEFRGFTPEEAEKYVQDLKAL